MGSRDLRTALAQPASGRNGRRRTGPEPGAGAELSRRAFLRAGEGCATPAGSPQAPSSLRTHLSWSAGDRAAAQAIFTQPPGQTCREKPGLNSARRFPRQPHFRRKSCPPKRLCFRRFSPSVCSSTCRSASGSLVSDVASKPLARGSTHATDSFAFQDLAKTSPWGAWSVTKIGLSVYALSWPISHCVWLVLTSLVLRVGLHTAGDL